MPARALGDPIPDRRGFVAQCNAHDGMAVEDGIATPVQVQIFKLRNSLTYGNNYILLLLLFDCLIAEFLDQSSN